VPLAKKFVTAEKELKKGDIYFTGYSYESRHSLHMDTDWTSSEPFRVNVKDDEIKLDRPSKRKKKGRICYNSEDESGPVGILFLHRIVDRREEIIDAHLIELERSYEFTATPIYWFGDATVEESFRNLEGRFEKGSPGLQKTLIFIISTHNTPKSYDFLCRVARGEYDNKLRKNAIFWLGNYLDSRSLEDLKDIYKKEKDQDVKEQIIFALSLSDQQEAVVEMINIAKKDKDQKIRKNALFWLGQKASEKAVQALKDVVESDEDLELKDSAVFAISQLPEEKSVPMLIDIAKTNRSPSVRKKAIFWLGEVGSDEALKFFEEILLKKK
jgi:HEAT repeat protein